MRPHDETKLTKLLSSTWISLIKRLPSIDENPVTSQPVVVCQFTGQFRLVNTNLSPRNYIPSPAVTRVSRCNKILTISPHRSPPPPPPRSHPQDENCNATFTIEIRPRVCVTLWQQRCDTARTSLGTKKSKASRPRHEMEIYTRARARIIPGFRWRAPVLSDPKGECPGKSCLPERQLF